MWSKLSASNYSVAKYIGLLMAGSLLTNVAPANSDPATAMLVLSLADSVLSVGQGGPDITIEMLQDQSVMLKTIHDRLNFDEAGITTLLQQVANLPSVFKDEIDKDGERNRREILQGWIDTVESIADNLKTVTSEKNAKQIEEFRSRLRTRIEDLQASRTALFQRSDFVVPAIVTALNTEIAALRMLPRVNGEIPRVLAKYDERLASVTDPSKNDALVNLRKELESQQDTDSRSISKEISGLDEPLRDGQWIWYTHTFRSKRDKHTPVPVYVGGHGDIGPQVRYVDSVTQEDFDDHSRTWSRSVLKTPLPGYEGTGLFTITVSAVPPSKNTPGGGGIAHSEDDNVFETDYAAKHDISGRVLVFNLRAKALAATRDIEQLAVAARLLVSHWDDNEARRLNAQAYNVSSDDVATVIQAIGNVARNTEARNAIIGMSSAREQASREMADSRNRLIEAEKKAADGGWRNDLKLGIQLLKISSQAQQLAEHLNALASIPKRDSSVAAPTKSTDAPLAPDARKESLNPNPNQNAREANSLAISGLNDQQKVDVIRTIIAEVSEHPSEGWDKLPNGPTLEETKLSFAITLLNSMSDTFSDKQVQNYKTTIDNALSGSPSDILRAAIMPTPTAGEDLVDAPARQQYRIELNKLARPFAERRVRELLAH